MELQAECSPSVVRCAQCKARGGPAPALALVSARAGGWDISVNGGHRDRHAVPVFFDHEDGDTDPWDSEAPPLVRDPRIRWVADHGRSGRCVQLRCPRCGHSPTPVRRELWAMSPAGGTVYL